MSNKLSILEKNIPLRAIPEETLNKYIIEGLMPFICRLLSLKGENASERLEMALEPLKKQCIGMGFSEIKKMFEMYADNELNIEPRTNYFDRVLLGRIITEYRKTKKHKPKPIDVEQEKKLRDQHEIILIFDYYKQNKELNRYWEWVYVYLEDKGIHKFSKEDKAKKFSYYKNLEIQGKNLDKETQITMCRISLLKDYFDFLIQSGKEIKDLLQ